MMKGRQYDRRFLSRKDIAQPKVYAIEESNFFKTENGKNIIEYFANGDNDLKKDIDSIIEDMMDAKEYGSIIIVNQVNFEALYNRFADIKKEFTMSLDSMLALEQLLPLVEQAEILSGKYDVVVTNPPYMGSSGMNQKLLEYLKDNYKDTNADLSTVFMEKGLDLCTRTGYMSMINIPVWMFLVTYENLRKHLINNHSIINLIHLGRGIFGSDFGTVSFVISKMKINNYIGTYRQIFDEIGAVDSIEQKKLWFLEGKGIFLNKQENYKKVPGYPITAYWASENTINGFGNGIILAKITDVKQGLKTGDNGRFLRLWHEVGTEDLSFYNGEKWFPCNKGGKYRRWYGNNEYVINWESDGYELKNFRDINGKLRSRPQNLSYQFKEGLTYTNISSSNFGIRYSPKGFMFDAAGSMIFTNKENLYFIFGFLSSKIVLNFVSILSPNMSFEVGELSKIPIILNYEVEESIVRLVKKNISISKLDWDMNETSWDFSGSALLKQNEDGKIEAAYKNYKNVVNERFEELKRNEEELNRIFVKIYNLEEELTPEVSDRDITVAKIFDSKKDIDEEIKGNEYIMTREDVVKNFLSYFIGCAMGRYSLDEEGLVFAGGEFDMSKYTSFKADEDGIIPITDQEYFENDIVELFVKFLKITFGKQYLNENLDFIASELKGKKSDSSREKIRNYFLNDFYKDHCKMYKVLNSGERPIYWQYDSGKNDACKGLFYLHRYDKDMFAKIRIKYIFEIQDRYKQELARVEETITKSSGSQKIELQKRADGLKKKIIESQQFEEKVQHIADSYIEIDLDDGVKENYKIFKDVLSKIK